MSKHKVSPSNLTTKESNDTITTPKKNNTVLKTLKESNDTITTPEISNIVVLTIFSLVGYIPLVLSPVSLSLAIFYLVRADRGDYWIYISLLFCILIHGQIVILLSILYTSPNRDNLCLNNKECNGCNISLKRLEKPNVLDPPDFEKTIKSNK